MAEYSKIEWTDHTWNPWMGCTKVSPGCLNCYAEVVTPVRAARGQGRELWGKGSSRQRTSDSYWKKPLKWNEKHASEVASFGRYADTVLNAGKSFIEVAADKEKMVTPLPRVFPSLCDWLDAEVPIEWLVEFLELIRRTPDLTWLLLTKRPENWDLRITEALGFCLMQHASKSGPLRDWIASWKGGTPPANVWVGTSVEDQIRADERIPALLSIPAVGRFISAEPLLGPVDLGYRGAGGLLLDGARQRMDRQPLAENQVDWVIIGGESGPGSRPCNVDWIRSIVRDCRGAGVPCFVKQLGAQPCRILADHEYHPTRPEGKTWPIHVVHKKGGDLAEWPEDLRVREFPNFGGAR